jgi:hypothetical protein
LVFTAVFLVVTLKICIDTTYWTWLMHMAVWVGSIGSGISFALVHAAIPDAFGDSFTEPGV